MTSQKRIPFALLLALAAAAMLAVTVLMEAEPAEAATANGPGYSNGKLYFFRNGKRLRAKSEKRRLYKGKYYYVLKNGRIRRGWNTIGKHLYCFGGKKGAMLRSTRRLGITILPNGRAQKSYRNKKGKLVRSLNAWNRYYAIRILKRRGVYNKGKKTQLRSAWNHLMSHRIYSYALIYPGPYGKEKTWKKSWPKRLAYIMFTKHHGNCYGFACAFAAFARVIGYDPYIVYGKTAGGRDRSLGLTTGGLTRHAMTRINGKYYDPEYWYKYKRCYTYGASYPICGLYGRRSARYRAAPGSIHSTVKTIAGNLKLVSGRYYFFNASGKARSGVYFIKGYLYHFKSHGTYGNSMTKKQRAAYKDAIAKGQPYAELKELIGEPRDHQDECDHETNPSRTFIYKHIYVTARKNGDGEYIISKVGDLKSISA